LGSGLLILIVGSSDAGFFDMEDIKEKRRKYYLDNIDRIKEKVREYQLKNPDKIKELKKIYREENKEKVRNYERAYRIKNKEKIKKYREKNKGKIREHAEIYNRENREKIRERKREPDRLYAKKRSNNPIYRLNHNLSTNIRKSLEGNKNGRHWEDLVGYTQIRLKEHLEKQFKDGMTWENYGRNGWTIDHKIPISIFNITSTKCKGFKAAWKLENLQPLWAGENSKKKNKLFQ